MEWMTVMKKQLLLSKSSQSAPINVSIQSYIEVTRDLEGTYWMDLKILWDASCVVFFNVIDFVVGFLMQKRCLVPQ